MGRAYAAAWPTVALLLAAPALAAEGVPAGGSGSARVKGDAEVYRVATPKSNVTLQARGAGDLTLKIRAVLPSGSIPSAGAKVRVLDNGTELAHLSLSIYASGAFSDRPDSAPSGAISRSLHLGEGNHLIAIESRGGNAAVAAHWKPKHVHPIRPVPVPKPVAKNASPAQLKAAPLADLSVAPLTDESPAPPAPQKEAAVEAVPLTPAPSPTDGQLAPEPAPAQAAVSTHPAPAEATQTPAEAVAAQAPPPSRSPLPFIFAGTAALCAAGSGVTVGLAVSQYSSYNSTPEMQGGVATNRAGMLNTANGEVAAAEILGAAAAAFLVATGVSMLF